jgi:hypothetical protein
MGATTCLELSYCAARICSQDALPCPVPTTPGIFFPDYWDDLTYANSPVDYH